MNFVITALMASALWAPIETTRDFEVYKVGDRSYALKTRSGLDDVGSNSGFIHLGDHTIVIDTHLSSAVEKRAQQTIAKTIGAPIRAVINTHFHSDHSSGNPSYPKHVSIWAHESSIDEMRTAQPKRRFESISGDMLNWQNEDIDILSLGKAHSVGDIVVYDRKDKVLYTGDVFVNGYVGYLSEAHFTEWIRELKRLERLEINVVVPGHGKIASKADLIRYRVYLQDFAASAQKHFDAGGTPENYELPEKYKSLGAQFYLEGNVARAFELWRQDCLTGP